LVQIKDCLPLELAQEFKTLFLKSQIAIKGKCVKNKALKQNGNQYSFWEDYYNDDLKALKQYQDTISQLGLKNCW